MQAAKMADIQELVCICWSPEMDEYTALYISFTHSRLFHRYFL